MASRWLPLRIDCEARYHEMEPGDGSMRGCERCATPVHDLSARTAEEARTFRRANPDACIRYLYEENGRVVHTDRPPSIIPSSWLVRAQRAALIAATLGSPLLLEACGPCASDACGCITEDREPINDPKECPANEGGNSSSGGAGGGGGSPLTGGAGGVGLGGGAGGAAGAGGEGGLGGSGGTGGLTGGGAGGSSGTGAGGGGGST